MAFMMPVMKNEFDIYKTSRTRHASECSNTSNCRSRKVSETRSECPSFSTSPGTIDYSSPAHRANMNRTNSRPFSRTSSRTSQSSLTSPTKTGCSPPKPTGGSQNSLNKFHIRLVDKLRKSLRKGRSEDRSWVGPDDDDLTIATAAMKINTDKSTTISNQLSFTTNTPTPTPITKDCGLRFSDSILHITSSRSSNNSCNSSSNSTSKPPLPRGITVSTTHRNRSRSIETATLTANQRGKLWNRKLSHTSGRLIGAAEAR